MKTYTELMTFNTFEERFKYLKLDGVVGDDTFGYERYLNQILYKSSEWRRTRNNIIIRDGGCDLGVEGYEIHGQVIIHHMNPISIEQVKNRDPIIFDEDLLICTCLRTHNAIHYGDDSIIKTKFGTLERKANDTKLW